MQNQSQNKIPIFVYWPDPTVNDKVKNKNKKTIKKNIGILDMIIHCTWDQPPVKYGKTFK